MTSRHISLTAIILAFSASAAFASPECCLGNRGPTLAFDFEAAPIVILGHVDEGPKFDKNNDVYTDITIDQVLKSHEVLKLKAKIAVPRAIPKSPAKFLLFCDVFKGRDRKERIDPYRGVEVLPGSEVLKYMAATVALKSKSVNERLKFSFDNLDNSDFEISLDAYHEFAATQYNDYKDLARTFPPDRIAGWLKDPKTPPYRLGLYASLLACCGNAEHAKLLRFRIDDALKRRSSELESLLKGYVVLQPKEAWAFVLGILRDDKQDFASRHSCVRTIEFLRDKRPGLIENKDLTAGVILMLEHPDLSDFGIDQLRKSKCWECTPQVLGLYGKKTPTQDYDFTSIKRAILRFALVCPDPRALAFIQQQRKRNPDLVTETEELMKLPENDQ